MGQDRASAAIERVERAISRIEAAAREPSAAAGAGPDSSELRAAYRTLRSRVEGAVGDIDRILAKAEQG
jgi:hypothetical protein